MVWVLAPTLLTPEDEQVFFGLVAVLVATLCSMYADVVGATVTGPQPMATPVTLEAE